jgi:hypothetical protein
MPGLPNFVFEAAVRISVEFSFNALHTLFRRNLILLPIGQLCHH